MRSDGDSADAKECRDGGYRQSVDFMHHDDSSATRRQVVECSPHYSPDQKRPFRVIVLGCGMMQVDLMTLADGFLAPMISSNVDEDADQPCLLIG